MNRKLQRAAVLTGAMCVSAALARAQEPELPPPPPTPFGGPIELLGFEGGHLGRVVKGAPYSASATSETVQTLADGTKIQRTTTSSLFRDSQGRSRREVTLSGFGPLAASGKTHTMVTIADPVAGAHYMLDTERKIAHKVTLGSRGAKGAVWFDNPEAGSELKDKIYIRTQVRIQQEEASGALKEESLGTQTISGVTATGTRYSRTIAAGEIGNDRPIQVVSERWFSSDLQIVVKSTRTDPRFGTTTYTVANIQRAEPDASLFTVPADFTIQQGGPGGHRHGLMGKHATGQEPPPPLPNE